METPRRMDSLKPEDVMPLTDVKVKTAKPKESPITRLMAAVCIC